MKKIKRREVLKSVLPGALALTMPTIIPARAFGANERVRVAVIGFNSRGKDHISNFMKLANVEVAGLCDVDKKVLQSTAADFEKKYGKKPKIAQDMRTLFDDKDIDAVSIATPNHWHALATVWACQAGKDVYVEKPASHDFNEGRIMIRAAEKYQRIVQNGIQLRSSAAIQEAIQHLRNGLIGNVYMARGVVFKWRPDIGDKGNSPVPEGLDWNLWQGPAAERPFSENYVHYNWHWFWDYGNGDIGNQGAHEIDLCTWGLDVGFPDEVSCTGGKFLWKDCKETPEVLSATFKYPKAGKLIQFEVRPWMTNREDELEVGNIFYGDKGYMTVNWYDDYKTFLGQKREPGPSRKAGGDHYLNFIEAVRSRDKSKLNGPIETGHVSAGISHLANISYRLDRSLKFDPKNEKFIDDAEANQMLSRKYRAPFELSEKI
ncbi:MAG TPA: Gfo/Idh/MocA family oxidoreductase [Saprospiraceae bacterium]|nr:Gfo/Idh/MocA family oxidoreductase [Saprospiraceae bacterium]HNT20680.1 Gfo/Idh/MocA family oxidoreductase [Saprospiraceae bacterium]